MQPRCGKIGGIINELSIDDSTETVQETLHQPPSFVAEKPPAILGLLPLSILPIGRNHLDPFLA